MRIRRLDPGDETAAAEVLDALTSEDDPDYFAPRPDALRRFLRSRDNVLVAAWHRDRPAGFLTAYLLDAPARSSRWAYFYDVLVRSDLRRRGIATALVEELRRVCREAGVDRIWVGTGLDNTAARRLFGSTGAEQVSETYVEYVYRVDRAKALL